MATATRTAAPATAMASATISPTMAACRSASALAANDSSLEKTKGQIMSFKTIAAFAVAASMGLGSAAYAQPALKSMSPAANGTVSPALKEIRFDFSETVVPAFSGAKLTDPKGKVVPTGTPRVAAKNKKEL